jgi:hypothetical protein
MNRRLGMLFAAAALTVTSVLGFTGVTAAPAGAAEEEVDVAYVVSCITVTAEACLANAVETLLGTIDLPTSLGASATPTAWSASGAPELKLPASTKAIIEKLPPALQTNPVASAPDVQATVTQLMPTAKPRANSASSSALPKVPSATPIKFLNASGTRGASTNPLSATDIAGVVVLGLAALGALKLRRRAAVTSD